MFRNRLFEFLNSLFRNGVKILQSLSTLITLLGVVADNVKEAANGIIQTELDFTGKLVNNQMHTLLDIKFGANPLNPSALVNFNRTQLVDSNTGPTLSTVVFARATKLVSLTGEGVHISQSRQYVSYQPGKTQEIALTGRFEAADVSGVPYLNAITRKGYFDASNGVFFALHSDTGYLSVNIRNAGDGTTRTVMAPDFNGVTTLNLDTSRQSLFFIKFLWFGVANVQFGVNTGSEKVILHTFRFLNQLNYPYMSSPNLPLRWELEVGPGGSGSMLQGCGSITAAGGGAIKEHPFSIANTGVTISGTSGNDPGPEIVILALTGRVANQPVAAPALIAGDIAGNEYYHQNIRLKGIKAVSTTTNDGVLIRVYHYDSGEVFSTSGTTTWTAVDEGLSVCKWTTVIPNPTFVGKSSISSFPIFSRQATSGGSLAQILSEIESDTSNVPSLFVITAQTTSGGNNNVTCTLDFSETY